MSPSTEKALLPKSSARGAFADAALTLLCHVAFRFQFALLFMLEGAGVDVEKPWSLFKVSVVGMFLLLSVCFFGRIAVGVPRARGFGAYFALVNFIGALIFFVACFYDTLPYSLVIPFAWHKAAPSATIRIVVV